MSQPQAPSAPIQIAVLTQYIRDFSFESPNAPAIFTAQGQNGPVIDMGINVQTRPLDHGQHEVVLMIKLEAKADKTTVFIAELAYAGVFGLPEMPEDRLRAFLFIEGPHLLFPFARNIIADAVRNGGFPQVLINPIDFASLYQQQREQMNQPAQGSA